MVLGLTPASTERIEIEIRRRGCVGSRLLRRRIEIDEHQEGVLNPSAQISLQHLSFVCNAIGWPRLSVQIVMPSNHPFAQSFGDGLGLGMYLQLLVNAPHVPRDGAGTDARLHGGGLEIVAFHQQSQQAYFMTAAVEAGVSP